MRHILLIALEPRTLRLLAVRSNQLSYETSRTHGCAAVIGVPIHPQEMPSPNPFLSQRRAAQDPRPNPLPGRGMGAP